MKNIPSFEDFLNESYINEASKVDIKAIDLPKGKVFRATKDFNAADLPWETLATSFLGKFKRFNVYKEGVQFYRKGQPIMINADKGYLYSYYDDINSVSRKESTTYNGFWKDQDRYGDNTYMAKMIKMAMDADLVKIDSINDVDRVGLLYTLISDAVGKEKVVINGIEVMEWKDIKFDFNKGYLTITGFNDEGKREDTLIRDLLKADVKIS